MNKRKLVILPVALLSIGFLSSCSDNGISSRFDDLQSQINDIKTEISDLKTQISNLKKEMADADAAIKAEYDGKISEINKSIASLNTELENLNKKYQEDKEALTNDYTSKISNLKDYTDGKIAELNDKNNTLSQQLTDLSNKHDADKKALKDDYDTQIAALSSSSQSERDRLEQDYNDKLAALNQTFADAQTNLQNQITANKNAMDTFASNYLTEKAALELDYNTKISNLTTTYQAKVAEIEGSIATCNSNISTLQTEMNKALLDNQNDYNAKINALTGRVAALETTTYHTVTFDVAHGSAFEDQIIEHGEKVTEPVNPTRPGFTFEGWTYNGKPWVFYGYVVTEDMTLTANWEYIDYTVTFKNDDGTILETQEKVHYGDSVTYHGDIPVKPNPVDHYIYVFDGWDVDLTNITGDTVATAQYTAEYAPYTVNFYDGDDNLLYSTYVREGETANYIGDTPTKADDNVNKLQFQFSGWSEIDRDNSTISYKAVFEKCTMGIVFQDDSVYQYIGSSNLIEIPSKWNGKTIASIGSNAFESTSITSVNIPNTVESINQFAFRNCESLETVSLKSGLKTIGSGVFSGCTSLESIVLPESLEMIDSYYMIPQGGYTYCGYEGIFQNCTSLKSVNVPTHIARLDDYSFSGCTSLKEISIPSNIESIEEHCFSGCSQLESVTLSSGLTAIRSYAFSDCHSLQSISLPDTLQQVSAHAFIDCTSIRTISIPNGLLEIGSYAFSASDKTVIITERTYRPKEWALDWLGESYVVWGYESFVTKEGYTYALATNFEGQHVAHLTSFDPSIISFEIENSSIDGYELVGINQGIFTYNENIKTVVLPECITTIDSGAFRGCTSLETVHLPDSVVSIEMSAFFECSSLQTINLPEGLTELSMQTFSKCTSLKTIILPESIKSIEMFAFANCTSLESIVIPNNVTTISRNAFQGCSSLSCVILPISVTDISDWAFDSCSPSLRTFYCGTSEQWNSMYISGLGNNNFIENTFFYSENEPAEPGAYWHYVEGVPTVW